MEDKIKILFYDYLVYYETHISKLENNKSDTYLIERYNTILKKYKVKITSKSVYKIENTSKLDNEIHITKRLSIPLAFCKHLRNSIAHANIQNDDKSFKLEDFNKTSKTMYGVVEYNFLIELIKTIIH